jgi:glutamate--cysteine ligase
VPTHTPGDALDREAVSRTLAAATAPSRTGGTGLGLEVELVPLATGPTPRRVPLVGPDGILHALATLGTSPPADPGEAIDERGWWYGGDGGCRVSFEPGGQIEASTRYQTRPATAMTAADRALGDLAAATAPGGIRLVAAGIDVWAPGSVRQQLSAPRYVAMDRYLATRGRAGQTMMRDTASIQLNLDLGPDGEVDDRWAVTNLLAPVATATFACSPSRDGRQRSLRSLTWQRVDPTRTGFPHGVGRGDTPVADQLERFAMDADVLLVRVGDTAVPGRRGWRFRDWMTHGHPELGWPTVDDLDVHLTTLFPEVRPRGYLEVRSVDSIPAAWRRAPAVLYAGAVYDPRARERILEVLLGRATPLDEQLRQAAVRGVSDPAWCALAVEVWSFALEGAGRLPAGCVEPDDLRRTVRFLDHFTLRGRCPGDDLLDTLRRGGPDAAVAWSAEPASTTQAARP